ncbi:MAG TPA: adenylate/guanylate cyclase domain-containing protein [Actinomycetota bacterium]|nr:adenylate/guanylate cyclase domain-containing protein [Actinomycetota bacterium]
MNRPETRYAKSGDVHVAYQVTGAGPVDLVWAPGTSSHLDLDWDPSSPRARLFERIGEFCRLIRFDKRGTGLSDKVVGAATLEERTDDIRAVMDAAGSERAFVLGISEGANMACVFAATYPGRTLGLLIWGGQARWVQTANYPWGLTPEQSRATIADVAERGVTLDYLTGGGAGIPKDEPLLEFQMRYARASVSPSAIAALEQMNAEVDVNDILPTITVATLVMNGVDDSVAHVDAARDLASRIPGAKFMTFPGGHFLFVRDDVADAVAAEIEEFVTGTRSAPASDRVLATVLFTDIVGSTERAASLGDQRWRDLVERHHAEIRRLLAAHQGTEIDTAGDGFFATFDGPTRAVRCARAMVEAVKPLGIEVRTGVHTGEVETINDKVGGIAVNIGARVAAEAGASEVLVSQTVKDLVAGSGLVFEDAGEHELRGVPDMWRLYRLVG